MKLGLRSITLLALSAFLLFQPARADDKHGQGGSLLGQLPTSPNGSYPPFHLTVTRTLTGSHLSLTISPKADR